MTAEAAAAKDPVSKNQKTKKPKTTKNFCNLNTSHTRSHRMPHRLVLTSDDGERTFDFEVEREERGGWAWLRLQRIEDNPPVPGVPAVVVYDPAVHDGGSHYMSHLWRARGRTENGQRVYSLVSAFGSPGYMELERV